MVMKIKELSQDAIDTLGIDVNQELIPIDDGLVDMCKRAMDLEPRPEDYQTQKKYDTE